MTKDYTDVFYVDQTTTKFDGVNIWFRPSGGEIYMFNIFARRFSEGGTKIFGSFTCYIKDVNDESCGERSVNYLRKHEPFDITFSSYDPMFDRRYEAKALGCVVTDFEEKRYSGRTRESIYMYCKFIGHGITNWHTNDGMFVIQGSGCPIKRGAEA